MILNSRSVSRSTSLYPEFLNSPMYSGVIPSALKVITLSILINVPVALFIVLIKSGVILSALKILALTALSVLPVISAISLYLSSFIFPRMRTSLSSWLRYPIALERSDLSL